jgi:hypothetical protein
MTNLTPPDAERNRDPFRDMVRSIVRETIAELAPHLAGAGDELLDRTAIEARYPFKFRVVTDAARRGELVMDHAGRKPVVRRSGLEAWIASRPSSVKATGNDARAEARASIAAAAARIGGAR